MIGYGPLGDTLKCAGITFDELMSKYPESERLSWNRDNDNYEVLKRSDIMISDFSGVIFDFALVFDKPVIYTDPNFDKGPYDAWWIDEPLWTFDALQRFGKKLTEDNLSNLPSIINECLNDPKYAIAQHQIKDETWACRGEGAARIVDYIMDKHQELNARKEK